MQDILERVLSRTHIVYTDPEEFDRFDQAPADDNQEITLPLLSVPNPNIFAGCCILGANFEQTILFHYLKKNGRVPVPHAELTSRLRYSQYPSHVGSRTTIKYCLEHRRYSKTIRKETDDRRHYGSACDGRGYQRLSWDKQVPADDQQR